jgi:hypothetical protein
LLKVRSIAIHLLVIQQKAEVLHATKQAKNYDINPTVKKAKKELVIKRKKRRQKLTFT